MSAKEKAPFETMARKERGGKFTSLGTSIAEVEKDEKELKDKELAIRQDIQKSVQMLMQTNSEFYKILKVLTIIRSTIYAKTAGVSINTLYFFVILYIVL